MEGKGLPGPLALTRHQLLLGDDAFVVRYQQNKKPKNSVKSQKLAGDPSMPLDDYRRRYQNRNEAMAQAYLPGAYTMLEIAEYFGVHYMTVSRAVRQFEQNKQR